MKGGEAKAAFVEIKGGTGKNIAFSQICKEVKEKYDYLAVLSPYFDIFECNEFVDHVYKPNEVKDFLEDAIEEGAEIFIDHIYETSDFIYKEDNYSNAFRKMLHLEEKETGPSELTTELSINGKYPAINNALEQIKKELNGKSFMIWQFEGGQSPLVQVPVDEKGRPDWSSVPYDYNNEPLKRHYPRENVKKFAELFREKHPDIEIVLYQLPNENRIEGAKQFQVPYLTYYELAKLPECLGTVSIDSSLQHLVSGVTKSLVLWAHSSPDNFGYKHNKNILQKCNRKNVRYFTELGPSGAAVNYIKPEDLLKEVDDYFFEEVKIEEV